MHCSVSVALVTRDGGRAVVQVGGTNGLVAASRLSYPEPMQIHAAESLVRFAGSLGSCNFGGFTLSHMAVPEGQVKTPTCTTQGPEATKEARG